MINKDCVIKNPSWITFMFILMYEYGQLCLTPGGPGTVALQAPLSMGFSRQKYWSGLPILTPADLLDPGIRPMSIASPILASGFLKSEPPGSPQVYPNTTINVLLMCFGGGVHEGQQALLLSSHSGPAYTPSS